MKRLLFYRCKFCGVITKIERLDDNKPFPEFRHTCEENTIGMTELIGFKNLGGEETKENI